MQKTIFFISQFILVFLFSFSSFAEVTKIPQNKDFVLDFAPVGFNHKYEKRNYYTFIIEYLPEGEKLEEWTQMLSITGFRKNHKFVTMGGMKGYVELFFQGFTKSCQKFKNEKYTEVKQDHLYKVSCIARNNNSIIGGKNLKWEYGVYRFIETDEMVYQVHFVTHGAEKIKNKNKSVYFEVAEKAVNNVSICNLGDVDPCQGLDYYSTEKESAIPAIGAPPCRKNESLTCYSAALFNVMTADSTVGENEKKISLMFIDFSKYDLTDFKILTAIFSKMKSDLKSGAPGISLVIRGDSPNVVITGEDRVKVGTFITLLRMALLNENLINADSISYQFQNFK